ncbi:2'-5' RNA ligase family protein [Mongoliitalea daihaiensis]|uniref:2'-5' RNA ligase family protein n=1 Tax=Mongoliitalea daihaiensis TaxID=2782006 RepID=UPI001F334698|nr:2'-5' RNA ligase family protein [Mongoliitalea daihaiensis]UJP66001.1 2'-5' RNA ligase family protein [Mongoliitalea daihaiensis]
MAKSIAKYFIALVPEGKIQEEATRLKELLKQNFHLKYALKSPAHVTIKMPFHWNEAKEDKLIAQLGGFFKNWKSFDLAFNGFDRFGKRVIFIALKPSQDLKALQEALGYFTKTVLKQPIELSDKAFHPHMTIAFKDIKPAKFDEYWQFIKQQTFDQQYQVTHVALLKRLDGRWSVIQTFPLDFDKTSMP